MLRQPLWKAQTALPGWDMGRRRFGWATLASGMLHACNMQWAQDAQHPLGDHMHVRPANSREPAAGTGMPLEASEGGVARLRLPACLFYCQL